MEGREGVREGGKGRSEGWREGVREGRKKGGHYCVVQTKGWHVVLTNVVVR